MPEPLSRNCRFRPPRASRRKPPRRRPDAAGVLVSVALDAGYFDQAHLINESRALTGLTPSELVGSSSRPTPVARDDSAAGPSGGADGACVSSAAAVRPI